MRPNKEQLKSLLRALGATFSGLIAGYFAGKGWADAGTVTGILTSETFASLAASAIFGIWGMFVHTEKNATAVVVEIAKDPASPVKTVITTDTPAGHELAESIPGPQIAAAGTREAVAMASTGRR